MLPPHTTPRRARIVVNMVIIIIIIIVIVIMTIVTIAKTTMVNIHKDD